MTRLQVDPIELNAAIEGLQSSIAELPDTGHVLMTAGSARLLNAAALMWLQSLAFEEMTGAQAQPAPPASPQRRGR